MYDNGLSRSELLSLAHTPLSDLIGSADRVRCEACGASFDICSIMNVKSGLCTEDCRYCAQSAHWNAHIDLYSLMSTREICERARRDADAGTMRFSLVASGHRLGSSEITTLARTIEAIRTATDVSICASLGLLAPRDFATLADAGLARVHNNLETSRSYFGTVCTTHSHDDKLRAITHARAAGLEVCSGGIIGLGESLEDRIDLALELRAIGVMSVPLNILDPIAGTPLEDAPPLSHDEILRTVALFRLALPTVQLRLAGGRRLLPDFGRACLRAGVNAVISGDMLTTDGCSFAADRVMALDEGFVLVPPENTSREPMEENPTTRHFGIEG